LINNLVDYELTYDELKANFKYAGGDKNSHNRYFKLCYKEEDRPAHCNYCLCDHYIEENCYITDGSQFIVLGNCCIKKFIPKCTRTCEDCGKPHKTRTVNKCADCKFGKCYNCGKRCKKENIMCLTCTRTMRPCKRCDKLIERYDYICEECRICVKMWRW
jgi:hypothetical protein